MNIREICMELALFLTHISFLILSFSGIESASRLYSHVTSFYAFLLCISIEYIFLLIDFFQALKELILINCRKTQNKQNKNVKKIKPKLPSNMKNHSNLLSSKDPTMQTGNRVLYNSRGNNNLHQKYFEIPKDSNNQNKTLIDLKSQNIAQHPLIEEPSFNLNLNFEKGRMPNNLIPFDINAEKVILPYQTVNKIELPSFRSIERNETVFKEETKLSSKQKQEEMNQLTITQYLAKTPPFQIKVFDYIQKLGTHENKKQNKITKK